MFLAKKIIGSVLMPLPFCLILAFVGLVLLWFTRRQVLGRALTTAAIILLSLFSFGPTADLLLAPLEEQFPPLDPGRIEGGSLEYIVVLGGGHTTDPRLAATSQINDESLARLAEAIRLKRLLPGSKLLLSGGRVFDPTPNGMIMARVATDLGLPEKDLVLEIQSRDTEEEAFLIRDIVGSRPFVLLTSASHLPRSMALFEHLGMHPIPAPARHLVKKSEKPHPLSYFPDSGDLRKSERAVYEYLGMAWSALRGRI